MEKHLTFKLWLAGLIHICFFLIQVITIIYYAGIHLCIHPKWHLIPHIVYYF